MCCVQHSARRQHDQPAIDAANSYMLTGSVLRMYCFACRIWYVVTLELHALPDSILTNPAVDFHGMLSLPTDPGLVTFRIVRMVTHPVIGSISNMLFNFNSSSQGYIESFPQLQVLSRIVAQG